MTTNYPGREDETDLGNGHSYRWFSDEDGVFGLIEHHPNPERPSGYCGGYIAWRKGRRLPADQPKHQLVAGGPDDPEHLTIAPSLQCRTCPSHGFILNGRWEPA